MNRDNIIRLAEWLESDPVPHSQSAWVRVPIDLGTVPVSRIVLEGICGTTVCAAAAEVAFSAPPGSLFSTNSSSAVFVPDPQGYFWFDGASRMHSTTWESVPEGSILYRRVDIEEYAIASLGITEDQANFLFNGTRNREEVIAGLHYLLDFTDADGDELMQECT